MTNSYMAMVTARVNQFIPKCAIDLKIDTTGIRYHHPTRGWKRVSFRRMGIAHTEEEIREEARAHHHPHGSSELGRQSAGQQGERSDIQLPHDGQEATQHVSP